MTKAVQAQHIMLATLSGALVVLFGAFYALFFALGAIHGRRSLKVLSYLAHVAFCAATLALSWALRLEGYWLILVVCLLLGYLLAPHGIWHLAAGTHKLGSSYRLT